MANRVYPAIVPNPVSPLGWDGTDWRALYIDNAGRLVTVLSSLPGRNSYGNVLIGFQTIYSEKVTDSDSVAGDVLKYGTNVPANFGLVLQNVWATDTTHSIRILLSARVNGIVQILRDVPALPAFSYSVENTEHVLQAGDCVVIQFLSVTLHDALIWGASGYLFATA